MLKTLRNAFKIKDVRNRILFTFMMLIVIRIGSELPIPGVKGSVFQSWLNSKSADGLGFVDAITGGSFSHVSICAEYYTIHYIFNHYAVAYNCYT